MARDGGMIEYAERCPGGVLHRSVERFWAVRSAEYPYRRETILPDGAVEIMFTLGPSHGVVDRTTGAVTEYHDAWVAGQRRGPILVEAESGYDLVGVRFRPHGATTCLGVPQDELTGQVMELHTLWSTGAIQELREQLVEAPTMDGRLGILEATLTARVCRDSTAPPFVQAAVAVLGRDQSDVAIRALADRLGVSHRRLIAGFDRYVGLRPKTFQRIVRFQRVVVMEDRFPTRAWSTIAAACGYSDQAHMINEFRDFAGLTPERYRQLRAEYPNYVPEPESGR